MAFACTPGLPGLNGRFVPGLNSATHGRCVPRFWSILCRWSIYDRAVRRTGVSIYISMWKLRVLTSNWTLWSTQQTPAKFSYGVPRKRLAKKKKTGTAKWICAHSCIIRALIRESLLRSAGLMCVLCVLCVDPFSSLFFCKPLAGLDKPPVSHTTCLKKPQVNMNLPKSLDVVIVHYMQHSLSRHICQMNGSKVPRGDLIQLDMLVHSINKRTQLNPHLKEAEYFQILLW